jgi:hypothetical protein
MDQVTPSNINQVDGSFISALGGEAINLAEQQGANKSVREKEKAKIERPKPAVWERELKFKVNLYTFLIFLTL